MRNWKRVYPMPKHKKRSDSRGGRMAPYTGLKKELGRCRKCGSFKRGQSRHPRSEVCEADESVSPVFSQPIITDRPENILIDGRHQENPDTGSVSESDGVVCECCGSDRVRNSHISKDRGNKGENTWPLKISI